MVNLMRAAWRMASARVTSCSRVNREPLWTPWSEGCSERMTSFVARRSMRRAPTAMAAVSWRVSQASCSVCCCVTATSSTPDRSRVMVSSLMLASASARRRVHSGMSSTNLRATGISHSGSSLSDTRMVSPMPSVSKAPMPTALLMRPSSPSPASVTPRCKG